jgi:hypothetical protein
MTSSLSGYRGPSKGIRGGGQGDRVPSGYRMGQIQQFTPAQTQLFSQNLGMVSPDSYLGRLAGGDQSMFDEMEAPAFRQFNELQGNIASRFSGMGMGGRRSSGFQNTMTSAASNFAQDLAAQRQNLQRQAITDLMSMSGQLLQQRPQERFLAQKRPKKRSFLEEFGLAAAPGFGQALGSGITGGFGGM